MNYTSKNVWLREEISGCECDEKSYRHVHSPCDKCSGRATDRSTKLRHWRESCTLFASTGESANDEDQDGNVQDDSSSDVDSMEDSDDGEQLSDLGNSNYDDPD